MFSVVAKSKTPLVKQRLETPTTLLCSETHWVERLCALPLEGESAQVYPNASLGLLMGQSSLYLWDYSKVIHSGIYTLELARGGGISTFKKRFSSHLCAFVGSSASRTCCFKSTGISTILGKCITRSKRVCDIAAESGSRRKMRTRLSCHCNSFTAHAQPTTFLVSTTHAVHKITLSNASGVCLLSATVLQKPTSVLSRFIPFAAVGQGALPNLISILPLSESRSTAKQVILVGESLVQKWTLLQGDQDRFVLEHDVGDLVRQSIARDLALDSFEFFNTRLEDAVVTKY